MNTPAPTIFDSSLYFDAPTTPDAMTDPNRPFHAYDARPSPTAAHNEPAPEYARGTHTNAPSRSDGPKLDTVVDKTAHERAATAESTIPHPATSRLSRSEVRDAKRMSKVLKGEARTDDKILKAALNDLERLQKLHKDASKDEVAALASYSKAVKVEHKMNMRFLDAQAKHEGAIADVKAREAALSAMREHVRRQGDLLRGKENEIQEMRGRKAVDDREREAKLKQLTVSPTSASPV